jgi:hypothetical protein
MQALKGDATSREMDDADDIVMSFGAAKAVATGNPAIMEHAKAQSDLARLEISESNHDNAGWRLQKQVAELPEQIEGWEQRERTRARSSARSRCRPSARTSRSLVGGQALTGTRPSTADHGGARSSQKGRSGTIRRVPHRRGAGHRRQVAGVEVRVWTSTSHVGDTPTVTQHWQIAAGRCRTDEAGDDRQWRAAVAVALVLETGPRAALEQATRELATLAPVSTPRRPKSTSRSRTPRPSRILRDQIKTLEASLNLDAQSLASRKRPPPARSSRPTDEDAADAKAERALESAEDGDLTDEATPANRDAKPIKRGTTLQSTILPGAAEFGEHILEPALKVVAEEVRRTTRISSGLFAPDPRDAARGRAAGIMRANLAARDQRQQRARRSLRAVEKMMDGWSHDQSLAFWDVMEGTRAAGIARRRHARDRRDSIAASSNATATAS